MRVPEWLSGVCMHLLVSLCRLQLLGHGEGEAPVVAPTKKADKDGLQVGPLPGHFRHDLVDLHLWREPCAYIWVGRLRD